MQIELSYMIAITLILLFGILTYTKKMSVGIGLISILGGLGVSYYFAPYTELIIKPLGDSLMYGYALQMYEYVAMFHLFSVMFILVIAMYNLYKSKGKISWA